MVDAATPAGAGPLPLILNLTADQVRETFAQWSEPAWRADQLLQWLYARRTGDWSAMSNLPQPLRHRLAATFDLSIPSIVRLQGASDTTQKFLWRLRDGALIESVLIPANPALYGDRADRHTLCVSTQVGCAYGCRFCASGLDGWKRNLEAGEIIGQWLAVERWHDTQPPETRRQSSGPRLIDNLVIMGMGEPLANYDPLLTALRTLNAPWGGGIGARKITVSTSGLVPQIRQLAEEPEQFRLAISLHGATDDVRSQIMPVNRKYPVSELTRACEYYLERKGRMITLEYILLSGINDAPSHVKPLGLLARRLHAKVNLIPYNAVEGLPWVRPPDSSCVAFAEALRQLGVATTLRLEKGHDIDAACGQLRLKTELAQATAS
ncbi:MAG: 23S rRNA (adenine(2503)-C(2))-methyltransferase RlmN [Verrucomicrobiales bacterium]|nr:23S rRNA (adenine(2503)-C(2))-methyltransferase RlmN [Verrucomicrobiales bacterium]